MPTPEEQPFDSSNIRTTIDNDTLDRSFRARLELARLTGEKLLKEHRENVAHTLMSAGISLIPSEHLLDHQFIVSQGVYDAAKRIGGVNTREIRDTREIEPHG